MMCGINAELSSVCLRTRVESNQRSLLTSSHKWIAQFVFHVDTPLSIISYIHLLSVHSWKFSWSMLGHFGLVLAYNTAQKMKFSIIDFFSNCDQIRSVRFSGALSINYHTNLCRIIMFSYSGNADAKSLCCLGTPPE